MYTQHETFIINTRSQKINKNINLLKIKYVMHMMLNHKFIHKTEIITHSNHKIPAKFSHSLTTKNNCKQYLN